MIGGLVLAGGAGRRFGGVKQLALLEGVPLLQHPVDAMTAVAAIDRVVVVLGAHADAVAAAVRFGRAEPVLCAEWELGMSASLRAGVRALGDVDWAVVTLGDQPGVTMGVIETVVDAALGAEQDVAAVRATYDGREGHPVVFHRRLLPAIATLSGDSGGRSLLAAHRVQTVEVGHSGRVDDVDTLADLQAMRSSTPSRKAV